MTAHAGQLIAARRFRLGAAIGDTPLGVRWAARDAARVAEVEFFSLHSWVTPGPAQRRAFDEATSAIARLRHDALAPVLAHGVNAAGGWLVTPMRYGRPLDEVVANRGRFEAPAAARLLAPVADAIAAAHAQGILHGDLRPAQISVDDDVALLSGLGLAPFALVYGAVPEGLRIGERPFMAPERAAGRLPSAAADAYALGAILHWLVTPSERIAVAPLVTALRRRGMRSRPTLALAAEWLGALARDEALPSLPAPAQRGRVTTSRNGNLTDHDARGDTARHETVAAETAATGLGGAAATPSAPMAGVGGRPAGSGMPSAPPAPELPEQPPRRVRREGPVAAPPAPAPDGEATAAPARERRTGLRLAVATAVLALAGAGAYMVYRAVHDDGGARAAATPTASTAATTSTPVVTTPTATTPTATTPPAPAPAVPAAALHRFPSHTCVFSVPAGYAPIWVDLDRGDVSHSEALAGDGARIACDVPLRPLAARAAARAARRGPLPPGYRQESLRALPGGGVAWIYRARPGAPADPTEVRAETRFYPGGTAVTVQAPVARSTDLAATFAAVLASFRPRRG